MGRDTLAKAAAALESAADAAGGEAADRLRRQAEQLASLAEADRGPDHGRLARHQEIIRDVKAGVDDGVADSIDEAYALINEYRSTLEGV